MIKFNLIIVIIIIVCDYNSIFGCTCDAPVPPSEEYARMDAVFSGKVINIVIDSSSTYPSKKVYIDVFESWKGDLSGTITIWTDLSEASCGYNFEINSLYLIYAYNWDNSLSTHLCTRTRLLIFASEDLEYLESLSTLNEKEIIPQSISMYQNYPNPFNASTRIKFYLDKRSNVEIVLYNLQGKIVHTLVNKYFVHGYHSIQFDARNLPSGIYFYRLFAQNRVFTKKMLLIQ